MKAGYAVALDEAARIEPFIFGLIFDAAQAFSRRPIVSQLEHTTQQDRYILEFY